MPAQAYAGKQQGDLRPDRVQDMLDTPFYIACLRLSGRRCVVVEAATWDSRRSRLLACDGEVTLVSPEAIEPSRSSPRRARSGGAARVRPEDLEGTFIVIAATGDTDVNIRVFEDAERLAMLVNVVDVPPLCNFILPAIIRSGPLAVAISTAGASPALAKRIRDEIADEYGEPYAQLAVLLNDVRGLGQGDAPNLPGPQGVLRGHRQRRARPRGVPAPGRRAGRPRPGRGRPALARPGVGEPPTSMKPGARMVDVGGKPVTERRAVARSVVRMSAETAASVARGDAPKGDVLGTARIAGIQAAKRTGELILLCHPLPLSFVDVEAELADDRIVLTAEARTIAQTGSRWRR